MHPPRLSPSRLGSAFLQRSFRYNKICLFANSRPMFDIRPYSSADQRSSVSYDQISQQVATQSRGSTISDPSTRHSVADVQPGLSRQKPTRNFQNSKPFTDNHSLRSSPESGRWTDSQEIWRATPRVLKQYSRRLGKRQRAKKSKAYIWQQLFMIEQQLELAKVQMDLLTQGIGVVKPSESWRQLGVAEQQLELVEVQILAFALRVMADSLTTVIGRRLGKSTRHLEVWTQLDLAERQLSLFEVQIVAFTHQVIITELRRIVDQQLQSVDRARKHPPKQLYLRKLLHPQKLISPHRFLTHWLSISDAYERERYWSENKDSHRRVSLSLILVAYLRNSLDPNLLDEFDQSIAQKSLAVLQANRYSVQDLASWAWILSAKDGKGMTERFTSTPLRKPDFLLLVLLRRDDIDLRSFKLLLIYSWERLLQIPKTTIATEAETEINSLIPWSEINPRTDESSTPLSASSFSALFSGLLRQARRLWPAAIASISYMVESFIQVHIGSGSDERKSLDKRKHYELCKLYNRSLQELSLPSTINPFKSMTYNWHAQRVVLKTGTLFEPAFLLDRNSYRAVAQVLGASKRSESESMAAALRTRSWPPWRVEQDGIDALRQPEDDLSRALVATNQAKESGYKEEMEDRVFRVLGGQERDGTPTIPTRMISLKRRLKSTKPREMQFSKSYLPWQSNIPEAQAWAARIEATRDVQESWAAFLSYQKNGYQPNMAMYSAMFKKLFYDKKRCSGTSQLDLSPGEGRELLPPANDNYSSFYQSRLQPPSIDDFYKQMRQDGIRPTGKLLSSLVEHAPNPSTAIAYLVDSKTSKQVIAFLQGYVSNPNVLRFIPDQTFTAFITLLCRLAPRIIPDTTEATLLDEFDEGDGDGDEDAGSHTPTATSWRLLELKRDSNPSFLNPLLHCARLLKNSRSRFRPAWYAFFRGLVRRRVVIDRSLIGNPKNDIVAWRVLVAALSDFHKIGLELDPHGFRFVCIGLEKALRASSQIPEEKSERVVGKDQLAIVVHEFGKLSEAIETTHHPSIPKLMHLIEGAHLHGYVRVLGLGEDLDGLIYLVRWMVTYHAELDGIAHQSRNGHRLLRRTLVALKVFLGGTEHEPEAENLVNSVGIWDGWPNDEMAESYIKHYPLREKALE